ncbi:hypothetical protein V1523DRAFT_448263 [Lipomyces doorenjongii]
MNNLRIKVNLFVFALVSEKSSIRNSNTNIIRYSWTPLSLMTILISFTVNNTRVLAPFVTFLVCVLIQGYTKLELTAATAFTALFTNGNVTQFVNTLLRTIPTKKSALAGFDRIQKFLESPSRQPHVLPLNAPPTLITAGTSVSITPDLLATETLNTRKYESESDAIEKSIDDVSSSECGKSVTERKAKAEEEELKRPVGEFTYKHSFPSIGWSRSLLSLVYLVLSGVAIKLTELLITYWTSPISKGDNEVNPLFWDSTGCWLESKSLFGTSPSGSNNIPHEKQYPLQLLPGRQTQ